MRVGIVAVFLVMACGKSKEQKEHEQLTQQAMVVPKVEVAAVLAKDAEKLPLILVVGDKDARLAAAGTWESLDKGEVRMGKHAAPLDALRPFIHENIALGRPPIDSVEGFDALADGPPVELALEDLDKRTNNAGMDDPPPPEEEDKPDDGTDESGGTGTAMALEEGKMGKKDSDRAAGSYQMKRVQDDPVLAKKPVEAARIASVLAVRGAFASLDRKRPLDGAFDDGKPSRLAETGGVVIDSGKLDPLTVMIMVAPTTKATRLIEALVDNPGAIAVSHQGKVRPLRIQFELKNSSAPSMLDGWIEVRVTAKGVTVEAVPDKAIEITDLKQLEPTLATARTARGRDPETPVDVLVDPGIDAQRLVDVLVALDVAGEHAIGLGSMPNEDELKRRGHRIATTSFGQPNAQGELDKAVIRRYVKRNGENFSACYQKGLTKDPSLSGTVMIMFMISSTGAVSTATASGVSDEVSTCVAGVVKAIEFPKPASGNVQVNYPITFRP
jgi:hypothetical protein